MVGYNYGDSIKTAHHQQSREMQNKITQKLHRIARPTMKLRFWKIVIRVDLLETLAINYSVNRRRN